MLKRRLKQAGLPAHYSPHSFRATGITNFLEKKRPSSLIRRSAIQGGTNESEASKDGFEGPFHHTQVLAGYDRFREVSAGLLNDYLFEKIPQ